MSTEPNRCARCSTPLPPDAMFCPNCNEPAPGSVLSTPSPLPPKSARSNASRGFLFWLLLLGAILMGLCASGLLGATAYSAVTGQNIAPAHLPLHNVYPIQKQVTLAVTPTPISESPSQVVTQPQQTDSISTQFEDDFSNVNSGWPDQEQDEFAAHYSQKLNYLIRVKVPESQVWAIPPYHFAKPVKNVIVKVRVKKDEGSGSAGILCRFTDNNNFYRVGINGSQFTVNKKVNGKITYLTQPDFKDIIAYTPNSDGYLDLTVACIDGRIQVLINDVGQVNITDDDLASGDAALFVYGNDSKNAGGFYDEAYFKNFSAEVPQP